MSDQPVLELDNIVKEFPVRSAVVRRVTGRVRAVDDVTLSVLPGETVALVGESGSGKSTLARLALLLIKPTSGRVLLMGRNILNVKPAELRSIRRSAQIVFQDPYSSLDPRSTVGDSIGEPLSSHFNMKRAARSDRVAELLERVGLSGAARHRYPHEFSGGQLQRIALARALSLEPRFIIFDEALSSLDVSIRADMISLLETIQGTLGIAYLFISHDLSVVQRISHRVAVMHLGRLVESGRTDEVSMRPKHPYTKALLSAVPVLDPELERTRSRIVLAGDPPSPLRPPTGCRFHTRCQNVMDICRNVDPPATVTAEGTTVFCHLYDAGAGSNADLRVITDTNQPRMGLPSGEIDSVFVPFSKGSC